ncbi:MAG TPA: glycosyltransferase family 9 protein [Chlamydiales bacterium]|jgi:ADP-heptose:LPS heptosyltransferase|nr:glycosyltransferase family 9 protein [Chlamydiales bacterium]
MDCKKIAVIRRNGFGDTLCTIPLILYCKQKWPEAKISLFLEEKSMCLAPFLVGPDRIVSIPTGKNKYFSALRLAWKERRNQFDLAISAKTSPMKLMNTFLFALGARERRAYTGKSWDSLLVNRRVRHEETNLHQAVQILRLIEPNIETIPSSLYPKLKGIGRRSLAPEPALFYSVSNNRAGCTLSLERAAFLLNRLAQMRRFCTIINSLPQDQERAKALSLLLAGPSQVVPTEKFGDFLEVLNSCDAAFVGDGGACHLASALEKPLVALFGGTILARWHPLNDRAVCFANTDHVDTLPEDRLLEALKAVVER